MLDPGNRQPHMMVQPLGKLAQAALSTAFLQANIGKVSDNGGPDSRRNKYLVAGFMRSCGFNKEMQAGMLEKVNRGCLEIETWTKKHEHLFQCSNKKFKSRTRHLKLFIESAVWNRNRMCIDQMATAEAILATNADWPLLQFQFACAYAHEVTLMTFDKYHIRGFKTRLCGHPLYEFWFLVLDAGDNEAQLFDTPGIPPHQAIHDATHWAMKYGFVDVVRFVWFRLSPWQQEYLGMLHWRQLCSSFLHEDLFTFMAAALHSINPRTLFRITTSIFMDLLRELGSSRLSKKTRKEPDMVAIRARVRARKLGITYVPIPTVDPQEGASDPWIGIQFIIENSLEQMRHYILTHDNFLALVMSGMHRDFITFRYLLTFLPSQTDRNKLKEQVNKRVTNPALLDVMIRTIQEEPNDL